jgi:hypothetical protein
MSPFCKIVALLALAACGWLSPESPGQDNLLVNGDFEHQLHGWSDFWSRTPGGQATWDDQRPHGGSGAVRIQHTGSDDWSFTQQQRLDVRPGQIYELSGWVRLQGDGTATLSVILYDADGKPIDWSYGGSTFSATPEWQQVRSRFLVPDGVAAMVPRLMGTRPATVWLDDAHLELAGSIEQLRAGDLPPALEISNSLLHVRLDTRSASFAVTDRRTGQVWRHVGNSAQVVLGGRCDQGRISLKLLDPASMLHIEAVIALQEDRPELLVQLQADGPLPGRIAYPPPVQTAAGQMLIMPVNEGISYPVDDSSLGEMYYHMYGGHGLCMGWWGVTNGRVGVMALVETPDDAGVRVSRSDGLLCPGMEWLSQQGDFGPQRRLRYVFFDDGGYVAMCKRYRRHSQEIGLFKTLAEKRRENPHVDLLVGAVNVWCWDPDAAAICREMQAAGIDRIQWSHRLPPEQLQELNAMGVLTSRYDIYQDVMDPANFDKLHGVHGDWTTAAWPDDLMRDANGDWIRGWRVRGKDGQWYPCGVLCDRQAVAYALRRIPAELQTHPYRCRFIDTTTASPWRECYDPRHPVTRSESRHWKMELLRTISETCGLVCGSETGHEAAVPFVHYFEGMLSLGPYRVPDAGRNMGEILDEVPERVAKFQTGHYYRLPLWELVYHDCVVAQWYWGDYNNKLPGVWDRRDLFNALYGTPPMFLFRRDYWRQHRDRFVRSYQTAATVARATGYQEMLSHRWLTDDHSVQQTEFANGVTVTANFGDQPYEDDDGHTIQPLAVRVEGTTR